MDNLQTSLVILLSLFAAGIVAYFIEMALALRQIEKKAKGGVYDARSIRKLLLGMAFVGLALIGVSVVSVALMFLSKLPLTGALVYGIIVVLSLLGVPRIDWVQRRLGVRPWSIFPRRDDRPHL